ncbi:S15/NS1 RNA-binding domain-containing protein [Abortiporus biennis]|nr:S15/NS1 RNA-binding domain-containing protein [Abortiporus biennis]
MLRTRLAHCSRAAASTSTPPVACLHTSTVLQISQFRKRKSRIAEKLNTEKREERAKQAALNRPHVILGNRPGDEAKWTNCDLAKVLVTPEEIKASPPVDPSAKFVAPHFKSYGIGEQETELLFKTLPTLTSEATIEMDMQSNDNKRSFQQTAEDAIEVERRKSVVFASLVDLRNANARGIAYENRKRIIAEFSELGKPNDTGRPEVQAAILTMRIRNLWSHLLKVKQDIANRRSLRRLVHERAKILKYLKSIDRDRYDLVLERIGVEPGAVEGELVV